MARRWAIRLILIGTAILILTAGTSVYHGDPAPGADTSIARTFVQVWWFTFASGVRQSDVNSVLTVVALTGFAALLTGIGLMAVSLVQRRLSQ